MSADLEELRADVSHVLRRHDVRRAAFFGSVATGDARQDSDVDILVQFKGKKSLLDLVQLKLELERSLRRQVDVLTYDSLSPHIRDRVLKEQVMII